MIRTLIIDDEALLRENTETLLQSHPDFVVVGTGGSLAEGSVLIKSTKPDLVLLDIQLGDGTGFELLNQVEQRNFAVIFVTAFNDQAIRAIKIGALDYLLKPLDEYEFECALNKVRALPKFQTSRDQLQLAHTHLQDEVNTDRIALKEQHSVHIVPHDDILYCQSDRGYTHFYLRDNKTLILSSPLKDYEDLLPEVKFFRAHNSYLVNRKYVTRYEKSGILHLTNGAEIPVAVRKREDVLQYLIGSKNA